MLQYQGTSQPPKPYLVPRQNDQDQETSSSCADCQAFVWTAGLYEQLAASIRIRETSFTYAYRTSSGNIRSSAIKGCLWCQSLADGIHGHVFLDIISSTWEQGSDVANGEIEDLDTDIIPSGTEDEHSTREEQDSAEYDAQDHPSSEPTSSRSEGSHLDDARYLAGDRDTLLQPCDFDVTMLFEADDRGLYSSLRTQIQSVGLEAENDLTALVGEQAVILKYHLNETDLDLSPSIFAEQRELSPLGSDKNFEKARIWMTKVQKTLLNASEHNDGSWKLPRRLIHLESDVLIRVVDAQSSVDVFPAYAALSYVWGGDRNFKLLESTKTNLMTGFAFCNLPKTIQDAITVTGKLGLRHLWIDALCIFQDSETDKAQELPDMSKVYKNAAVTILAAVASAADCGFLQSEPSEAYFIAPMSIAFGNNTTEPAGSVTLSYRATYERWRDPINERAWTFQEYLLSPRIIRYSYRGLDLLDRSLDSRPRSQDDTEGLHDTIAWWSPQLPLHVTKSQVREVWLSTRAEYSRRKLGRAEDKLVAIAAFVSELSTVYGRYIAGLWEDDLFLDLLWRRPDPDHDGADESAAFLTSHITRVPRPAQYRAPSWSWASIDGEVTDAFEDEGDYMSERLDFKIISCFAEPIIQDYDFGGVRSAILIVEGRLRDFIWRPASDPTANRCDGFLALDVDDEVYPERQFGDVMLDASEPDLVPTGIVKCLAMCLVERIPGKPGVEGLVLLPDSEATYRRIGTFTVSVPRVFDNIDVRGITIL